MELLEVVNKSYLDQSSLKQILIIKNLPKLCKSINSVISCNKDEGVIYCVWGQHSINRKLLKKGVRFSFPQCPNSLTLSVISNDDGDSNKITIHCETNTNLRDEDFFDSIKEFVDDWVVGLKSFRH